MLVRIFGFLLLLSLVIMQGCSNNSVEGENITHFSKSLDYDNQVARIINKTTGPAFMAPTDSQAMIDLYKRALQEARLVDIGKLNQVFAGFGTHYNGEFISGHVMIIQGDSLLDNNLSLKGELLLDKWGTWYNQNIEKIREYLK